MSASTDQQMTATCNTIWQTIRPAVRIALGLLSGMIITLSVKSVTEIAMDLELPWGYVLGFGFIVTLICIIRFWTRAVLDPSHDWKTLSMVANSKAMLLITIALSMVPLVLSISQAMHKQDLLPFDLYLYWVSGLSFFCFIVLYKAAAPRVFKYNSYRDLIDREGSTRVLRESLAGLQQRASSPDALLIPAADAQVIHSLDVQNTQHQEHIFFHLREYSKDLNSWVRFGLSVLLMAPAFFVITITLSKVLVVGHELNQTVPCYGGWIKAIYWNILKTSPDYVSAQKLKDTQVCLQGVAANQIAPVTE